jgi:adenylate kinase family enzyme
MSEYAVSETEARKMQIVTSITQSFFIYRLSDVEQNELELDADSKLFLLENLGLKVSQMSLGLMSAERLETLSLLADGTVFESDAFVYRPNNIDAPARMKIANLREDFAPGDLLMFTWSEDKSKAVLINLTTLSDILLADKVRRLISGPTETEADSATETTSAGTSLTSESKNSEEEAPNEESTETLASNLTEPRPQLVTGRDLRNDLDFDPIAELWARAYGGSSAAVSPWATSMADSWLGSSSPGLSAVEELASLTISSGEDDVWLFLVGGPGSGKSSFASKFLSRNGFSLDQSNGMHQRHYMANHPRSRSVKFVNDATVRTKGSVESLVKDMIECSESKNHLLTCVNRGVLADELNLTEDATSEFGQVLDWIVRGSESRPKTLVPIRELDYMQVARQDRPEGGARYVVVVFMDVASLLEDQPSVAHSLTFESLSCESLKVQDGSEGNLLGSKTSPFSLLLEEVASKLSPGFLQNKFGLSDSNPVLANAHQLSDPEFRRGLVSILRTSEIRMGSRLNYRAFWSLVARLYFGDLPTKTDLVGLPAALANLDEIFENATDLSEILELTNIRATEALFENRTDLASTTSFDPGLRFTLSVDPAMASSGEVGSKSNSTSDQAIYVKPIAHAFQSAEVGEGILETISKQTGNPLPLKKTPFDSRLDSVFASFRATEGAQKALGQQVARYSRYLLRISSVFGGLCHGRREALEWVSMWNSSPALPEHDQFSMRIDSLIKPKLGRGDLQQTSLISLLESRARPIVQTSESDPIFAKRMDNIQFSTAKVGADLFLVLKEFNFDLGRIKLDYSFMRELLNTSPHAVGVTEETFFLTPRLERTRSIKLLAPEAANPEFFAVVVGDRVNPASANQGGA